MRDLDRAEGWYRRSFALFDKRDRLGLGNCKTHLGTIVQERFREALDASHPIHELLGHLNEAVRLYNEALSLLPTDAVNELAVTHNFLGALYGDVGDLDRAVKHFRESIQLQDRAGNLYDSAGNRFNVATALLNAGRRDDALEYAEAALRGFESYGKRAAEMIEETRRLIATIRRA